ncbi:MAG: coproporphyrinogen III oxidase [Mucilaginibacter sp.]|nr:coproporphyrinogen III oxidase [Mucilaginibacter sp.]
MKKQFFAFAAAAMIIGSIVTGCGSEKATNGADSTKTDSAAATTAPAATDTTKAPDTTKTDTTKKPM